MRINKTEEIESNPMKSVEVNSIYIIFVFVILKLMDKSLC